MATYYVGLRESDISNVKTFDGEIENNTSTFDQDDVMKLKLQLMQNGIKIDKQTQESLSGVLYADYVTCSGAMLKIGGNHSYTQSKNLDDPYLQKREYVTVNANESSPFMLTMDNSGNFLLKYTDGKLISNDIGLSRPMIGQVEISCVAVHGDRIRVSLITGCSGDCKFCGMNRLRYTINDFDGLKVEIDKILKNRKGITRLFITGGNPKECDLPIALSNLEKITKEYSKRGIKFYDYMFAPRGCDKYFYDGKESLEYTKFLKKLKKIGITSVAIDIEMGNQKLLAKYAPFKNKIGTQRYLDAIKQSVEIFGKGNVRSNIIVGIEPMKDTLRIVEEVAKLGAEPCLSPYEPYKYLPEVKKPTWKLLYKVFQKTKAICEKYKVKMAPSKYATDTHNSIASVQGIKLSQTEKDAFYGNVKDVQQSIKKEIETNKSLKLETKTAN